MQRTHWNSYSLESYVNTNNTDIYTGIGFFLCHINTYCVLRNSQEAYLTFNAVILLLYILMSNDM